MSGKIINIENIFITGTGKSDDSKPIDLAHSVAPTEYGYPINTFPKQLSFSVVKGNTVYDVSADFNLEGKETLLNQFKKLILSTESA